MAGELPVRSPDFNRASSGAPRSARQNQHSQSQVKLRASSVPGFSRGTQAISRHPPSGQPQSMLRRTAQMSANEFSASLRGASQDFRSFRRTLRKVLPESCLPRDPPRCAKCILEIRSISNWRRRSHERRTETQSGGHPTQSLQLRLSAGGDFFHRSILIER